MAEDFLEFQKYFKEYQKLFGLTGYKVYFKHESIDDSFASVSVKQNDMVATVTLNSEVLNTMEDIKDVKTSAKHEALHLLLMKLECCASARYVTQREIYEASEELVNKLEPLLKEE